MKKYILAVGTWLLIILLAILNGGLRENVLNKLGSIDYIIIGIIWFLLTNMFDLSMILSEGGNFADLISSYNFLTGNLWTLVVLATLLSPIIVSKIKRN